MHAMYSSHTVRQKLIGLNEIQGTSSSMASDSPVTLHINITDKIDIKNIDLEQNLTTNVQKLVLPLLRMVNNAFHSFAEQGLFSKKATHQESF